MSGTAILALGYLFITDEAIEKIGIDTDMLGSREYLLLCLALLAVFVIVLAMLGLCLRCFHTNKCARFTYALLLLPSWIIVSAIGASALYISLAS